MSTIEERYDLAVAAMSRRSSAGAKEMRPVVESTEPIMVRIRVMQQIGKALRFYLMVVGLLTTAAVLGVVVFSLLSARGWTHNAPTGWAYPTRCCWGPASGRTGDCAQIPTNTVRAGPDGYVVTLAPGDHPLVKAPLTFVVPYADVEDAPDGLFHVCFDAQMKPRCFFAGGRFG